MFAHPSVEFLSKVEILGESLTDKKRMLRHPDAYLEALSD